ncbi:MAG: acetate--CoA ligase family protein [Candidatus Kariarchaeaceae archaeon]|jgi:acetyltransferase
MDSNNIQITDNDLKQKINNLDVMFHPQSIAVVGASRREGSIGKAILKNIIDFGYEGTVYPVNPNADSVNSIKCHPDLKSISEQIDLIIIVTPSKFVYNVMKEAIDLKIRSAVIITAGFKEIGVEGEKVEKEILTLAKTINMRVIGPNCMGIIHCHGPKFNATFAPSVPIPGKIGFISQSGALGVVVLDYATQLGLGFSKFVSLGNTSDVNVTDMLRNLKNDINTDVILAYIESFADPWNFSEVATDVSRNKPIIIVKSGKTAAGARAATSHTGALATVESALTATLSSAGVVRVSTVEELFDCAMAFSKLSLPNGNRVTVVTNAGGPGTLAADALIGQGLILSELSQKTKDKLNSKLPVETSVENPIDLIASGGPKEFKFTLDTIIQDESVDSIIVIFVPPIMIHSQEIANVIDKTLERSNKPILGVIMGRNALIEQGKQHRFPMYQFPESAVLALRALTVYGQWRNQPMDRPEKILEIEKSILDIIPNIINENKTSMSTNEIHTLLKGYGFDFPDSTVTTSVVKAVNAAKEISYPVVIKMATNLVEHKTEEGGVIVDIRSEKEFVVAWNKIQKSYDRLNIEKTDRLIIIQKYYSGGVEMALGASVDKQFGPIVMVGTGGILIEIMEDVSFGRAPISRRTARKMIRKLKGYPLLLGYRGDNPVDIKALEDSILKVSQLVSDNRQIIELDINPILLFEVDQKPMVLDARIKISQEK